MKNTHLEWGEWDFHKFVIEYPSGAGNRRMGADTPEELISLYKEFPPSCVDLMSESEIESRLSETILAGKNLRLRYNSRYDLIDLKISTEIKEWVQIEEDYNVWIQDGILNPLIKVLSVPVKFLVPIGASTEEIWYRKKHEGIIAEKQFLRERREKIATNLLSIAENWIEAQKRLGKLSDKRIRRVYPNVIPVGMDYLQKYKAQIIFDLGGEHETEKFFSSFDRRGGQSSGYYTNRWANPRASGGEQEWEELLSSILKGEYDDFIRSLPKPKKVIAPPKRLQK